MADIPKTPLLDELEKGKWPSFVTEIKDAAKKSPMCADLLGQLEQSYREKIGFWGNLDNHEKQRNKMHSFAPKNRASRPL